MRMGARGVGTSQGRRAAAFPAARLGVAREGRAALAARRWCRAVGAPVARGAASVRYPMPEEGHVRAAARCRRPRAHPPRCRTSMPARRHATRGYATPQLCRRRGDRRCHAGCRRGPCGMDRRIALDVLPHQPAQFRVSSAVARREVVRMACLPIPRLARVDHERPPAHPAKRQRRRESSRASTDDDHVQLHPSILRGALSPAAHTGAFFTAAKLERSRGSRAPCRRCREGGCGALQRRRVPSR